MGHLRPYCWGRPGLVNRRQVSVTSAEFGLGTTLAVLDVSCKWLKKRHVWPESRPILGIVRQ